MNDKQRSILLIGVGLLIIIVLFPPWLYFDGNTSSQASAGYHFLLSPPPVKTYEEMFGIPADEVLTTAFVRVYLDKIRLITQILIVIFLTASLMLRLKRNRSASSGFFMALGICAIVFLILFVVIQK